MQKIIYIIPILLIISSCEKRDCALEEATPISPIYYEYVSPIRPVFKWEGMDNRDYILETSEYSNFEPLIESVEVTGNTYSSPNTYVSGRHVYWRLKTKGCENILIDEVFYTFSYIDVISGQYRSDDGTIITYNNNSVRIGGIDFCCFSLEKKTSNILTFSSYENISSPMGFYFIRTGQIDYNIDTKTLSLECSYERYQDIRETGSFSFEGKLIE